MASFLAALPDFSKVSAASSVSSSRLSKNISLITDKIPFFLFFLLTDFLSIDNYYLLLKKTDIYICSWETQTGLSAIYTCLVYGVKCFLDGANYNIVRELGCIVFKITDLKILSVEEIIMPLTMEQKKKNAAIIKEWLNNDRINAMWNNFYSVINDDV